jgi:MFS family permease
MSMKADATTGVSSRGAGNGVGRKVSAHAIFVSISVILLAVMSQFYRSSIGVIAPNIMSDLHLSAEELGVVSGSFFFVFAALQIPIGILLDRYGTRWVVSTMLIVAVAGSLRFAWAESLADLVIGRLMIGIGFAGMMIGSLVVLRRWFPADRFTTVMSIVFASGNAGSLAATWPLAASATAWGWRDTFVGLTFAAAILTLAFFAIVRDAPPGHERHTKPRETLLETVIGLRRLLHVPDLPYLLPLIAVGYGSVIAVLGLWGGPYLHDIYGLDANNRGAILSVMAISMIVGTVAYGPLDRRLGSRKKVVTGGCLATSAALFALTLWPNPSLLEASALLSIFCFVGAYSVVSMAHGMSLFSDELSGRGTATLNTALMGGTALIQFLTGSIVDNVSHGTGGGVHLSYALVFAFLGALTLGALLTYRFARDTGLGRARPDNVRREASDTRAREDLRLRYGATADKIDIAKP